MSNPPYHSGSAASRQGAHQHPQGQQFQHGHYQGPPGGPGSQQRPENPAPEKKRRSPGLAALIAWPTVVVLAVVAGFIAIWQVNERVYTPGNAAEQYWESLQSGDGSAVLGQFDTLPSFLDSDEMDHLLLSGEPLAASVEQLESAELNETASGAELQFQVAGAEEAEEPYLTELPLTDTGTDWLFFDQWQVSARALTWFEIAVPGAPQGAIGQVQVNGEPVNLDEESVRLSAFTPTAVEIDIDSQWLVGSAEHVVVASEDPSAPAQRVTIDLEASEEATELLHTEVQAYFDSCSEQEVLMPSGCPVGVSTNHQVDFDTISWDFPDPDEISLYFDADGWHTDYDQLTAEVSFDALHYHSGAELSESEEMNFDIDIAIGADGEDLIISVTGVE